MAGAVSCAGGGGGATLEVSASMSTLHSANATLALIQSAESGCILRPECASVREPETISGKIPIRKEGIVKNLDRLKKQNVRSFESRREPSALSLDQLRQVSGGNSYIHPHAGLDICVLNN